MNTVKDRAKSRDQVRLDNSQAKLKNTKLEGELGRRIGGIELKEKSVRISADVRLVDARKQAEIVKGLQISVVHDEDYKTATRRLQLSRSKSLKKSQDAAALDAVARRASKSGDGRERSATRSGIRQIRGRNRDTPITTSDNMDGTAVTRTLKSANGKDEVISPVKSDKYDDNKKLRKRTVNVVNTASVINKGHDKGDNSGGGLQCVDNFQFTDDGSKMTAKSRATFDLDDEDNDLIKSLMGFNERPKLRVDVPTGAPDSNCVSSLGDNIEKTQKSNINRRDVQKPEISIHNRLLKLGQKRPLTAPAPGRVFEETIWSHSARMRIRERKRREIAISRNLVMRRSAPARLLVYFDANTMNRMFELQEVDGNRINYMRNHLVYDPDDVENADSLEYMYIKSGKNISSITRRVRSAPARGKERRSRKTVCDPAKFHVGLSRHKLKELNDSRVLDVEAIREMDDVKLKLKSEEKIDFLDLQTRIKSFIVKIDDFVK